MTKVFSVALITGAILAAVFFGGRPYVFSTKNLSSVAAASPATLQSLQGWYLKKDGRPDWTRRLKGSTSVSTDADHLYAATLSVQMYDKEGSRSADLITITEQEIEEQFSGKGKFCAVYAGILDRTSTGKITGGHGTYYNNDGGSGKFVLSKTQ